MMWESALLWFASFLTQGLIWPHLRLAQSSTLTTNCLSNLPWHAKVDAKCCLVLTDKGWCCSFKVCCSSRTQRISSGLDTVTRDKKTPSLYLYAKVFDKGSTCFDLGRCFFCIWSVQARMNCQFQHSFCILDWNRCWCGTKYTCCGPSHREHDIEYIQVMVCGNQIFLQPTPLTD